MFAVCCFCCCCYCCCCCSCSCSCSCSKLCLQGVSRTGRDCLSHRGEGAGGRGGIHFRGSKTRGNSTKEGTSTNQEQNRNNFQSDTPAGRRIPTPFHCEGMMVFFLLPLPKGFMILLIEPIFLKKPSAVCRNLDRKFPNVQTKLCF